MLAFHFHAFLFTTFVRRWRRSVHSAFALITVLQHCSTIQLLICNYENESTHAIRGCIYTDIITMMWIPVCFQYSEDGTLFFLLETRPVPSSFYCLLAHSLMILFRITLRTTRLRCLPGNSCYSVNTGNLWCDSFQRFLRQGGRLRRLKWMKLKLTDGVAVLQHYKLIFLRMEFLLLFSWMCLLYNRFNGISAIICWHFDNWA